MGVSRVKHGSRRRPRALVVALAVLLAAPVPLAAWDDVGHQVVAAIAWRHMKPETRSRVVALLRSAPADAGLASLYDELVEAGVERDRAFFMAAATWADRVRDRDRPEHAYHRSTWHYVNYFWEQPEPGAPGVERPDLGTSGEVLLRLEELGEVIGNGSVAASERAIALAWVLHLVGDLHQPLHTSARITAEQPEGDRGGNLFELGEGMNLHWYWDSILGASRAKRAGETELEYLDRLASEIEAAHPRERLEARVSPGAYEAWARESWELARTRLYPAELERGRAPSEAYREAAFGTATEAMALAGYRLAEMLDRLVGVGDGRAAGGPGANENVDTLARRAGH